MGLGSVLARFNKLSAWQAALIISVVGLVVYSRALASPFMGDDASQIVNNPVVHNLSNIRLFFMGGSIYVGKGVAPLAGTFYHPMMTTVYAVLYSVFGASPLYFHLLQLILYISCAFLVYLVFGYTFNPVSSLFLSLVFLVHPLNSQVVYALPHLEDVLYFAFGMLALYLLFRFDTTSSLFLAAICLFLSVLSKESGILFVAMAGLYLLWFSRKQLVTFLLIMSIPLVAYLFLRIHALGVHSHSIVAPIDHLSLADRILTMPSILLFYISKFIFPWRLASAYYWTEKSVTFNHVLLPLVVDVALLGGVIALTLILRQKLPRASFYTYLFFSVWAILGMLPYLQIVPLDMTASEPWFYFSLVGLLGALGISLSTLRVQKVWLIAAAIAVIVPFSIRTWARGADWSSEYVLAKHDIAASPDDYNADLVIATNLVQNGKYSEAKPYVVHATIVYPATNSYNDLGYILEHLGDYPGAESAYERAIEKNLDSPVSTAPYNNLAELTMVNGSFSGNRQLLLKALDRYPHDYVLWLCLAVLYDRNGDNVGAKAAITNAKARGPVPEYIYNGIMTSRPFYIDLGDLGKRIDVR